MYLSFYQYFQESSTAEEDVYVLDDFGLLTLFRDPNEDEKETYRRIPNLVGLSRPPFKDVAKQVKAASLATLEGIRATVTTAEAIASCSFLEHVSIIF